MSTPMTVARMQPTKATSRVLTMPTSAARAWVLSLV